MKKLLLLIIILLTGCINKVEVPNFVGSKYLEAYNWSIENDVEFKISSEYTDDILPDIVISQSIYPGEIIQEEDVLMVVYSRGMDPNGVISVPDFEGYDEQYLKNWLKENDITHYEIIYSYHNAITKGQYIGYETDSKGEMPVRKDNFSFKFSSGPLEIGEVDVNSLPGFSGVNLGGWFVLEGWMTPELFNGVNGSDETVFMQQKVNAEEKLIEHWETFITKDDFIYLKSIGIDYVRLPIPWWLFGGSAFVGTDEEVDYIESVEYIARAMEWADEVDMNVLLDLHTAPGGQNGFDNGGLTGIQEWGKNEEETHYVSQTVDVLERITTTFSKYDSLWGIEVLNEPAWGVDMDVLQAFYVEAYEKIRLHNSEVWIGFHDGFRAYEVYKWKPFFEENGFEKVFFDMHIYHVFGDEWAKFTIQDHLNHIDSTHKKAIENYDGIVPVVVGEWSYALPTSLYEGLDIESQRLAKMAFGFKEINTFGESMGWFFWSYKIDRNSHLEWDFNRLYLDELLPNIKKG